MTKMEMFTVIAQKELLISALKSFLLTPGVPDAHTYLSEKQQTINGKISHPLQVVSYGDDLALPTVFFCCFGIPFLLTTALLCNF